MCCAPETIHHLSSILSGQVVTHHTLKPRANLEPPIDLKMQVSGLWEEPRVPRETYAGTKEHADPTQSGPLSDQDVNLEIPLEFP